MSHIADVTITTKNPSDLKKFFSKNQIKDDKIKQSLQISVHRNQLKELIDEIKYSTNDYPDIPVEIAISEEGMGLYAIKIENGIVKDIPYQNPDINEKMCKAEVEFFINNITDNQFDLINPQYTNDLLKEYISLRKSTNLLKEECMDEAASKICISDYEHDADLDTFGIELG